MSRGEPNHTAPEGEVKNCGLQEKEGETILDLIIFRVPETQQCFMFLGYVLEFLFFRKHFGL